MEISLTDFEKHIYNTHLRISRSRKGQPFKYRKDFEYLNDVYVNSLKKISIFLSKFPHIRVEDFIKAPYEIYSDQEYFELEYYTTLKATKAYTLFKKRLETLDPDSDEQLVNIVESLKYISTFCREHNIAVDDYIEHISGSMRSCILHLKEHRVNVYSLFGFPSFERSIRASDTELLKFILGEDFLSNLSSFRLKFFASKKAKVLVERGIQKIKIQKPLD
jgi:hypothetical protein